MARRCRETEQPLDSLRCLIATCAVNRAYNVRMDKKTTKSGPEAERLKIDGDWEEKVREALLKPKGDKSEDDKPKPKPKDD